MERLYKRDPYHSYFGSDLLRFPVDPLPPAGGLHLKDRLVIVTVDAEDFAYSLSDLAAAAGTPVGSYEVTVRDLPLRISFDAVLGVADVEPLADPQRLEAVRSAFWFCWFWLAARFTCFQPEACARAPSLSLRWLSVGRPPILP